MSTVTFSINNPLEKILQRALDYDRRGIPHKDRYVPTRMALDAALHIPFLGHPSADTTYVCGMPVVDPRPYCHRIAQTPSHKTCDGCGAPK